ncbi:helix-turn-helix transcriptional regulator, partial [Nonomuraea rhizosphaerae]|uniref:helix-turn-helix transcriptional regulator n=1 Tax=Nonomuraea rhizosphaerae TaxID=2665663 RepID=UPI001C601182
GVSGRTARPATAGPLIGRATELARLERVARLAEAGSPQCVLIGGATGIGKTRLMAHVSDSLEEGGARIIRTTCMRFGTPGLPLAPVRGALRQLAADPGRRALRLLLPRSDALLQLLPEFGASDVPEPQTFELFGALLQQLGERRSLVLTIDDLQSADRATRDLLGFLVRTLRSARVLVMAAYRTDDLPESHPLRPCLANLGQVPCVTTLSPGHLNRAETAELLAAELGRRPGAELVQRLYRRSAGNPLFAQELARAGDAGHLPDSLRALLLQRVTTLPGTARHVVELASIADRAVPHQLLARVSGLPEDELLAAVQRAAEARTLLVRSDRYDFSHPLVRDAVRESLLPVERRLLHRAFAEAIDGRPDLLPPGESATQLAFHWSEAGEAKAPSAFLQAAGERLCPAELARVLDRMLSLSPELPAPERLDLHLSAIKAASLGGEFLDMSRLVDRALDLVLAQPVQDGARVALLYAYKSIAAHHVGEEGAPAAAEKALAAMPGDAGPARARILDMVAMIFAQYGRGARAVELAEQAAALAVDRGEVALEANARITIAWALGRAGAYAEAVGPLREAGRLLGPSPDPLQACRLHLNRASVLHGLGDYQGAIAAARQGVAATGQAGLARSLGAETAIALGLLLFLGGRWEEMKDVVAAALARDLPGGSGAAFHALLGYVALQQGDSDRARRELEQAETLAFDGGSARPWRLLTAVQRSEVALAGNEPEAARSAVRSALPYAPDSGCPPLAWALLAAGAQVERTLRLRARALSLKDDDTFRAELRDAARSMRSDSPTLAAFAAQVSAELGEPGATWSGLAATWEGLGSPYYAARAHVRAAEAALRDGDRATAKTHLAKAHEGATGLGARPMLEEIAWFGRQTGPRPPDERADGRGDLRQMGLTNRESDVLGLLAAGRSNRQIGEALGITTKTVSTHVSNLLAKLGVASRGEAAAALYRMRGTDISSR